MRSGELFAGVGGLGMAVDEVFNAQPSWFCEFDAAPSKVLAHHFPGVPNFGDVRTVDWATTERVNILAGGFPCQDVSLAGRRRGMKDGTRSGLWSEFAKAIDEIRPDWVVIENVRGLLSADAAVDMEPCPLCVGDDPGHVLRALGAVLGDLAELGFDAEWIGLRAADIGAPHGRFRVFILAWPREATVHARHGAGSSEHGKQFAQGGERRRAGESGDVTPGLTLLPTPVAQPSGNTPKDHLRKKPGREVVTDLAIIAENGLIGSGGRLLPTPNVAMAEGGQTSRSGSRKDEPLLGGIAVEQATGWGPYTAAIARWEQVIGRPVPVPVRNDGKGGKPRLNPELTEWMMGWPAGWVTAPEIGLTRAEQLKACGNGVVPQQAAEALRTMLLRPGVPTISTELAA
jgi:DNA (cytosine-5)-methyltransferase 1